MVSARRPFEATTGMEAVTQRLTHASRGRTASVAGHVPGDIAQAVARCLQKDPARRWPRCQEPARSAHAVRTRSLENSFHERLLRIAASVPRDRGHRGRIRRAPVQGLCRGVDLPPRARALLFGVPLSA